MIGIEAAVVTWNGMILFFLIEEYYCTKKIWAWKDSNRYRRDPFPLWSIDKLWN